MPAMNLQFTHPHWLWLALPALVWTVWWFWKSDAQIGGWRRAASFLVRLVVLVLLLLALGGLQWLKPLEGMNVFFLFDRSDSVPTHQQDMAGELAARMAVEKKERDRAGLVVFGTEAAVDFLPSETARGFKPQAVVPTERSDLAAAIRLAAAAFPETGQRRLVLATDGNENLGDALSALHSVRPLDVTLDVLPLGVASKNDVSMQRLALPSAAKKGQTFDVKLFVNADRAGPAKLRLYRSDQLLGEQEVELTAGKNLFSFPQTLEQPGFYTYEAQIEAQGDMVPQNNQATGFAFIRGEPRALVVSSDPKGEPELIAALQESKIQVRSGGPNLLPGTLAELQSYDTVFLANVAAGDIGLDRMRLLESAVRDFGVGLVAIGGDQAFAAGAYRGTPLEETLPVSMELDSKKVLPSGALALVIDRSGSMAGEKLEMAKQAAMAAVDALGPMDQVAVIAFDGETWIVSEMQPATDRKQILRQISGISAGGGTVMFPPMTHAFQRLKDVRAAIKHCVVLTDGVSQPGDFLGLCQAMRDERITVSTIGVGYDLDRHLLGSMAEVGGGRYYEVVLPSDIPNVFIKEVAVILKSAIFEEPFRPQVAAASELTRGLGGTFPTLYGYVCTTPKTRAEIPLLTEKGDPLLAHWQFGLGRAVAFTSDAKAKWAKDWLAWDRYRQFWSQIAQWSLRRVDNADFTTDVTMDRGEAVVAVEAIDGDGNYRNFLNLQTTVVGPRGTRQQVRLEQTGPGRYEARFPTKEIGAYMLNVAEVKDGQVRASQALGASVNYSPEFSATEPNLNLLRRLAEAGGGKILEASDNPFSLNRMKTFQPLDLWEKCLQWAILLFVLDVALRRIQLDRDELRRGWARVRSKLPFGGPARQPVGDPAMEALRSRRDAVRARAQAKSAEGAPVIAMPKAGAADFTRLTTTKTAAEPATPAASAPPAPAASALPTSAPPKPAPGADSTTSRLLDAKRRAQGKKPPQG